MTIHFYFAFSAKNGDCRFWQTCNFVKEAEGGIEKTAIKEKGGSDHFFPVRVLHFYFAILITSPRMPIQRRGRRRPLSTGQPTISSPDIFISTFAIIFQTNCDVIYSVFPLFFHHSICFCARCFLLRVSQSVGCSGKKGGGGGRRDS